MLKDMSLQVNVAARDLLTGRNKKATIILNGKRLQKKAIKNNCLLLFYIGKK